MFVIALAAAVAVTSNPSTGDCISTLSRTLEVSGEPAADVAQAVAVACDQTFAPAPESGLTSSMTFEQLKQISDNARRLNRDISLVLVMRLRACRKTPGCALASVQ